MIIELDYKSFCDIYYKAAEQVADIELTPAGERQCLTISF